MARRTDVSSLGGGNGVTGLFGAELRHAREQAQLSQAQLAKLIPCDMSFISHIERNKRAPKPEFAASCDELLSTGGLLSRICASIDWHAAAHPDWFRRYAELEAKAIQIREFQVSRISGLLQTAEYAQALFIGQAYSGVDPDLVAERVAARMSRQDRLVGDKAPSLIVILAEAAIRTMIGGPEVMRDQLAHLLTMAERPNIVLQVAPFDMGPLATPGTLMTLLTLPGGQEWFYSESATQGHFNKSPAEQVFWSRAYDLIRADVLPASQSADLIRRAMEGLNDYDRQRSQRGSMDQEQSQRRQRRQLHRGGPRLRGHHARP